MCTVWKVSELRLLIFITFDFRMSCKYFPAGARKGSGINSNWYPNDELSEVTSDRELEEAAQSWLKTTGPLGGVHTLCNFVLM